MISQILLLPEVASHNCSAVTLLAQGRPTKPDLFRLEVDGNDCPVVFKTYALKNPLVRSTLGRFVTQREYRMLRLLKDIEGIERTAYPPSTCGLFLKWIPGKALSKVEKSVLTDDTFRKLSTAVERMHRVGIVHLDIAHKGNVLVTPDGNPVLIDFQSALYVKHWPQGIKEWLCKIDRITLLKWKKKLFPHLVTPDDERAMALRKKLSRWWPWSHGRQKIKKRVKTI